jgi:hypothetical protein
LRVFFVEGMGEHCSERQTTLLLWRELGVRHLLAQQRVQQHARIAFQVRVSPYIRREGTGAVAEFNQRLDRNVGERTPRLALARLGFA